jgi:hypothetical protein
MSDAVKAGAGVQQGPSGWTGEKLAPNFVKSAGEFWNAVGEALRTVRKPDSVRG